MYVMVAGGGKVGRYLTETLINQGHEVLLIERIRAKVETISEALGDVVVQGDACEAQVLSDYGAARADVIIAVTGDDEDNLVICQVAKRKFGVKRVIARVNNPKNERIFKVLGIDATVSHTRALLEVIESELPSTSLAHFLNLHNSHLELMDAVITADSPLVNKVISNINFPPESAILLIIRTGKTIVPRGDTTLLPKDEVVVITPRIHGIETRQLFTGE